MFLDATGMREGQGDAALCGTTDRDATDAPVAPRWQSFSQSFFGVFGGFFLTCSVVLCFPWTLLTLAVLRVALFEYLVYFVVSSSHAVLFLCVLCVLWFLFFTCSSVRSVRRKMAFMTQRLHR